MADAAIAGSVRIIARQRDEWLRAFLGGLGVGVASMCCGVVYPGCAERSRFGADDAIGPDATLSAA